MNEYKNLYNSDERKQLIATELLLLRSQKGLSQKQVADELAIKIGTYSTYETGRSEPNAETIVRLAYLYGVSTDEILQKNNMLKDPKEQEKMIAEYNETMQKLMKKVEEKDPKAIDMLNELVSKKSSLLTELLKNSAEILNN